MSILKQALQQAIQKTKSMDDMLEDFCFVVRGYDAYIDSGLIEEISVVILDTNALNNALSRIINSMKTRQVSLDKFAQSLQEGYPYLGVGDRLYDVHEKLFGRIRFDLDYIDTGVNEIKQQAHLFRLFLDMPASEEVNPRLHWPITAKPISGLKRKEKQGGKEQITNSDILSFLSELGFFIDQNSVQKQFENLSNLDKMNLFRHLEKVKKGGGRGVSINPYLKILSDNIGRMKFSYTGQYYRLMYDTTSGEVVDIVDHDTYMKKYVSKF